MSFNPSRLLKLRQIRNQILHKVCILCLLAPAGCSLVNTTEQTPGLQETAVQLQIQQTMVSQAQGGDLAATLAIQQATLQAPAKQATQPVQIPSVAPTLDIALAAQQTVQVQQATQLAQQNIITTPEATDTIEPAPAIDLMSRMKTANILLYEDMISQTDTNRYVKDTLDQMGLPYKDDGNAQGWFKSDILSGAPNGKPWDLVILAAEAKSAIQGEYFEYVMDVLDKGSSVIMEVWYLDQTAGGTAEQPVATLRGRI